VGLDYKIKFDGKGTGSSVLMRSFGRVGSVGHTGLLAQRGMLAQWDLLILWDLLAQVMFWTSAKTM
jgi:hypothetical protein